MSDFRIMCPVPTGGRNADDMGYPPAVAKDKPMSDLKTVAWLFRHIETGRETCVLIDDVIGFTMQNPRWVKVDCCVLRTDAEALLAQKDARIAELTEQVDKLRGFAEAVLHEWWDGMLDGGDLQNLGETHGLLLPQEVTEPCGDSCQCAEYTADFPVTCYRKTKLLTGKESAP